MTRPIRVVVSLAAAVTVILSARVPAQSPPAIDRFLSPAFPFELVAARRTDRLAWIAYERGQRNIYTAAAPDFRPIRLTKFLEDDGADLSNLGISDDGSVVVFVRGHTPNREGWIANPTSDPDGAQRTIWAAPTQGGAAWRLCEGTNPTLSPDGHSALFTRDGQIYSVRVTRAAALPPIDKGEKPLIKAWGTNLSPRWSPDGTKIAFVSDRVDHSFIGVYDVRARTVAFLSPSVDRDTSPTWSPDSKQIAFVRRPGLPFGQQAQPGSGGIGNPPGPAYVPGTPSRGQAFPQRGLPGQVEQPGPRGGARGGGSGRPSVPGLTTAAFEGGYTVSFWVAEASTGEAREFWHNAPDDRVFTNINAIQWAGDRVTFSSEPEEWIRDYSVGVSGEPVAPVVLTPGDGMVENRALSSDGRTLYYSTNAGDIDRRHVWKVAVSGGEAVQLTNGEEIETYPVALASGTRIALLSAGARRPQSVGIAPAGGGPVRIIFPTLPKEFPLEGEVVPQNVTTTAEDGLEIHNQLFLPKDLPSGEKRPAVIFVHGGPGRQMLLGYHYMHFYHIAYAVNQWLASQGYVVMSVNYRRGIGYGKSFRTAPDTGAAGNAEYRDVVAAGKYLQARPDVDPKRIGIWGLSYGGLLTAQALARNSDIFAAGVDLAGVHLYGSSLAPDNVAYQSSSVSQIDKWTSPVLLVHGDDDRNVAFTQTTGLVQLLRAHNVRYELIVFPDDVHESLLYRRWIYTFGRMEDFLGRFLKGAAASKAPH